MNFVCFKCKNYFTDNCLIISLNAKCFICENCIDNITYDNNQHDDREAAIEISTEIIEEIFDNKLLSKLDDDNYICIFNIFYIDNKKVIYDTLPYKQNDIISNCIVYYLNKIQ